MIVCDLEQLENQVALSPGLQKAMAFLRQASPWDGTDRQVEIDEDIVYALFQSYETIEGGDLVFEAHRRYLDVQYVATGCEVIGWASFQRLSVTTPYDEVKDVCFGAVPPELVSLVRLSAGQLAILYPGDAHAPKLATGRPEPVRKIVIKVIG
jgi:YhcH/YjgK/YiaL family protein